jgi:uncharacterized protein (DUF885 family)
MRSVSVVAFLCNAAYTSAGATLVDVHARVTAQNAIFEKWYQADLKAHPEQATAYGDYRYNNRLDGRSLAAVSAEHTNDQYVLAHLRVIPTTGVSEQDVMSQAALLRTLHQRIDNYGFNEYEMPINQIDGPHVDLADLPLAVPFESVRQYEDHIARLHQIPHAFSETEEVLRARMRDGLMPVRFQLEKVPAQCDGVIEADPFLLPTRTFPAGISANDQERLTMAIMGVVTNEVLPAYRAFGHFIRTEYARHGRTTLAVTSLPGGEKLYLNDIRSNTTVSTLTPDQIHRSVCARLIVLRPTCWSYHMVKASPISHRIGNRSSPTRNTGRSRPSRSWGTFASTSHRCNPGCRTSSATSRVLRSRSKPSQTSMRRWLRTIRPARLMDRDRAE